MTQLMPAADVIYSLPMAEISLWAGDEELGMVTKLWDAKQSSSLRIKETPEIIVRRLTGIPHPRRRITIVEYEISFDGIYDAAVAIQEIGEFILYAKFTEAALHASGLRWLSRTFYGVTTGPKDSTAQGVDAMTASQTFFANFVEDETS